MTRPPASLCRTGLGQCGWDVQTDCRRCDRRACEVPDIGLDVRFVGSVAAHEALLAAIGLRRHEHGRERGVQIARTLDASRGVAEFANVAEINLSVRATARVPAKARWWYQRWLAHHVLLWSVCDGHDT